MVTTLSSRTPSPTTQRGAALLMAMLAVTLITTLAGGMVWQQYRALQVEAAERARSQAGWILLGALDWSRLILREDARTGNVDHPGEPWATPLAEARLSTFLAADKTQASDDQGPEAFLSGTIVDAQARYNLRNVVGPDGKPVQAEVETLQRLCAAAGLPSDTAGRIIAALIGAWTVPQPAGGAASGAAPPAVTGRRREHLPIRRFDQLAWLGLEPQVTEALRPHVDILPTTTPLNVNTASRDVLAAVLDVDGGVAERLVQRRLRTPFETLEAVQAALPQGTVAEAQRVDVKSSHFEVSGRLRLDERVLEERSLVLRRGTGNGTQVITLFRERRSLQLPAS